MCIKYTSRRNVALQYHQLYPGQFLRSCGPRDFRWVSEWVCNWVDEWELMETSLAVDHMCIIFLKKTDYVSPIWHRPSRSVLKHLYNVLYTFNTQQYISTMILYIHSGYITATCFDRNRSSSGQQRTFSRYNKVSTQWGPNESRQVSFEISYLNTFYRRRDISFVGLTSIFFNLKFTGPCIILIVG